MKTHKVHFIYSLLYIFVSYLEEVLDTTIMGLGDIRLIAFGCAWLGIEGLIAGLTIASLIGGALLIEVTFSWPGIALSLQEAISQRDYPVVQGIVVVVSVLVVLIGLIVDLIVAAIDPRIRY